MHVAVSCYILRREGNYRFTPIAPGLFTWSISSRDAAKGRQRTIERIQKESPRLPYPIFARLALPPGRNLERVHLELKVSDGGDARQVAGLFPVIVESRPAGNDRTLRIGYHPLSPAEWFEIDPDAPFAEQVRNAYSRIFEPDDAFDDLKLREGDKLHTLRLDVEPPSLLALLKKDGAQHALGLGQMAELDALLRVTVNQTSRAALGKLAPGLSREPYRTRLQHLLAGPKKSSVLVVGPAGSGKSTLVARAVHDLLEADGYLVHRNLDRTHNVLSVQGRHIIAGMSRVGQWEARAVELLQRARKKRWILWSDDVHAWPSLGRTTVSDRALGDFFRGPIARGDLTVIGECTPEQLSLLEHDSPALAACFSKLYVEPATAEETLAMLLHESRRIEAELPYAFHPYCFASILEYSASLYPNAALPGKALRALGPLAAKTPRPEKQDAELSSITPDQVLQHFSGRTGLPVALLSADAPLERAQLARELGQQVLGQNAGLEAALDLVLAIRARLSAPGRPYGVFLFTGPTGTGKTELAKCLAEYLYGDTRRLIRFDMGEFSGADAASRLIGDRESPDGLLTSALAAQPFCLVLLDEIEKAHPLVLNLLLQVFDDGRLADARGNVADFTRAVIVLTSNLGGERTAIRGFVEDPASLSSDIARAVADFFPAELFNRIDRVVPFEPLGRPIAREIAKKELARLAARPGLAHRNVFLHVTEAVIDHTLEHGYDAKYGARAVKRFIDRAVGDTLSRAIASERSAEMRVLWLHSSAAGLQVHSEALREAELLPESSPVETLLSAAPTTLPSRIPEALATLERIEREGQLDEIGAQLEQELDRFRAGGGPGGADRVHHLDAVRARFEELKRRFEALLTGDPALLRAADRDLAREHDDELDSTRFLPRRQARGRPPLQPYLAADKRLLADLAEVSFFESLLESAPQSAEHGAVIDVLRLAAHHERRRFSSGSPGLLEWLSDAYSNARGRFDAGAVALEDGRILPAPRLEDFRTLLEHRPRQATLRVAGVGVRSFLWAETGCHVRRAAGSGPEIVRVLVLPGRVEPAQYLRDHAARRAAFEASLEQRGAMAENPEALLPVVRRISFDPVGDAAATASIEDYRFAYVASREVRKLSALLEDFWLLAAGLRRPEQETP